MMSDASKKHHYVPRSLLARFSIEDAGNTIYVFDKESDRAWPSSLNDAGSENYFNTVDIAGERISFERLFQGVDSRAAALFDRIVRTRSLADLGSNEQKDLAEIVAVQMVRTKLTRTSMQAVAEGISRAFTEIGVDPATIENFGIPDDQVTRRVALDILLSDLTAFRDALVEKRLFLVEASGQEVFWTSDYPVQMFNSFPYGEIALKAPGIEIYFPISSTLALAFYCPSIERKLKLILGVPDEKLHVPDRARFRGIHDAMQSGAPTALAGNAAAFLNALHLQRAPRFIYAAVDSFGFAREMLTRHPEWRQVVTHTRVGGMGRALPAKANMPPGFWLVLYGRQDHFMMAVSEAMAGSPFIEVSTTDVGPLLAALEDQPLQQAVLFRDGVEVRGMREIKIEILDRNKPIHFRIVHSNDALNDMLRLSKS